MFQAEFFTIGDCHSTGRARKKKNAAALTTVGRARIPLTVQTQFCISFDGASKQLAAAPLAARLRPSLMPGVLYSMPGAALASVLP